MYTQFWPKTALFWPRGAHFDPKTQKYSETSCYNPKPCIPGQNLVSERLCHFWGLQAPQPPPRPPQTPPRVPGAQKWPKCTCTSPVLIINDKKTTFGWVNILTYFFTRNVPFGMKLPIGPDLILKFPKSPVFLDFALNTSCLIVGTFRVKK